MSKAKSAQDLINQKTTGEDGFYVSRKAPSEEQLKLLAKTKKATGSALGKMTDGVIEVAGCRLTPTGTIIPDDLSEDSFVQVVSVVTGLEAALQWIVGDLWAFAVKAYGERDDLAEMFGKSGKTLSNWASVCRAFSESSRRREVLSFTHHAEVSALPAKNADEFLQIAIDEGLSVSKLREKIHGETLRPTKMERVESQIDKQIDNVRKNAEPIKARKRWKSFAEEQAAKWSKLVDEIEGLE